tara:strand:- start:185 stop:607 length:423 start_codon:yes stop_codon:yes gene_type:complete
MVRRKAARKSKNPKVLTQVNTDLPTSVKVGYRDIEIQYVNPDFKTEEMTDCYGQYKAREGVIQLQTSICGQELSNVMLHECLHAICYSSGLNQAKSCLKEEDDEEIVVNQMTNYLIGLFRDNPWFLDFIKNNMNKSKDSV